MNRWKLYAYVFVLVVLGVVSADREVQGSYDFTLKSSDEILSIDSAISLQSEVTCQECEGEDNCCGDGLCNCGEDEGCLQDCPEPICGDGQCSWWGENRSSCPEDCPPVCGDGQCTGYENRITCPGDCPPICGDGQCTGGEGWWDCPQDCPYCGDGQCTGGEGWWDCPQDCPYCGDGQCTGDENWTTCPYDCPKEFMITFDDGPIPGNTDSILLQLRNIKVDGEPVRAGFFMVGDDPHFPLEIDYYSPIEFWVDKGSVKEYPDAVTRVAGLHHLIGNHTQHHAWFAWALDPLWRFFYDYPSMKAFVKDEITQANNAIEMALGKTPIKIFRPPYVYNHPEVREGAGEIGFDIIWGELPGDTTLSWLWWPLVPPVEELKKWTLEKLTDWDKDEPCVLIFHDILPVTYNHIGEIVDYLQDQGFSLVHFNPDRIHIQKTEASKRILAGAAYSPIDLTITDPDGLILNKQENQIPRAHYEEIDIDGDGELDDLFLIRESKPGDYSIQVIPHLSASPEETFSLKIGDDENFIVLAENKRISDIPEQPYAIQITNEGIRVKDVAPPTIEIIGCPLKVNLNSSVTVTVAVTDSGSGIAIQSVPNGAISIDTSIVGSKIFTVTAQDNNGNEGSNSCTYQVIFDFIGAGGFQPPIEDPPITNIAKAGSAIPVKWQLPNGNGGYISDIGAVTSMQFQQVACVNFSNTLTDPVETTATGETGLRYDFTANQYVYNWKTSKTQAGKCYTLNLKLHDGSVYKANLSLKY